MVSTLPMTHVLKTPPRPEFAALMTRLGFDDLRAAAYLGVPVHTFRKWLSGERNPNAAVLRLLDVLGTIEILAPALHDSFVPPPSEPVKRGRPFKIKEPA
ncbi:hypothetical protein UFOVP503_24 [uncultured Caudovirales phage]|uniref:HTH cro/C1-type domain-containing protein n=1 Tax=uncultured Caudovirales phage TaxID=2100421 RepID=A0A6J5MJT7_9CAUD|nr:hypothetical protein UFOVP503_24 [uncultured Caudovirales phage]CAB4160877.1 hypothetical protein UFOVP763_18 [uncultured Caudovirales phage]